MKTRFYLILWFGVLLALSSTDCAARIVTVPVSINSPDSSVRVYIMTATCSLKPRPDKKYYWYSNNSIISAYGSFSGRLLHGTYTSYYSNHFLRQQGTFYKGLKTGDWITWYPDGTIKDRTRFSHGVAHGKRELYDSSGALTMLIYYRNGAKDGKTKFFSQGKTDSTICFKKGVVVNKKRKAHRGVKPWRPRKRHQADSIADVKPATDSTGEKKKSRKPVPGKSTTDSAKVHTKKPLQHKEKSRLFSKKEKRSCDSV